VAYKQVERRWQNAGKLNRDEKNWLVSHENPACAFHTIVGNASAVEQAELICFEALGRCNHRASELNIAWIGPPGTGKTMFARAISKVLGLPFIELDGEAVTNPQTIFDEMQRVLSKETDAQGRSLRLVQEDDGGYFAPSCVVFIDEVHRLGSVAQSLLRATEPSTHSLEFKDVRLDTRAIQWQFATTDRGLLFDAFDTRFMKIELQPYTKDELAFIVNVHNQDIPIPACRLITEYYCLVTREALDAAKLVRMQRSRMGGSWEEAVEAVRIRDGIDKFGLSRKRVAVLKALGGGKKSLASLATAAGCKPEEMERFILPPLLIYRDGMEPLVETGSGGRFITEAGLGELDRRSISHKGRLALPKGSWVA
jgi:Holliday junction resolvasome RuvABC ATP-dependent DNA helicase subunit